MSIPILSACDLFSQEKNHAHVVVHRLHTLLDHDLFIPDRPHRHAFYQVLFIEKGSGVHKIDFRDHPFHDSTLFFLAPGQVHTIAFTEKENVKGVIVNFDDHFFHTFLAKPDVIDSFSFFNRNGQNSSYKLENKQVEIISIFDQILQCSESKYLRLYLLQLFYRIDDLYTQIVDNKAFSAAERLIAEFYKLIEKNYDADHYPKAYAAQLSVTSNHLNASCKKVTGKTAGNLIRDRIVLEIKRLLVNSNLNTSEISYLLGFDDISYFIKFFKKNTGTTPNEFRKNL